jgi:hypothetical protein
MLEMEWDTSFLVGRKKCHSAIWSEVYAMVVNGTVIRGINQTNSYETIVRLRLRREDESSGGNDRWLRHSHPALPYPMAALPHPPHAEP